MKPSLISHIALATLLGSSVGHKADAQTPTRPNFLFIITDDMRFDAYGAEQVAHQGGNGPNGRIARFPWMIGQTPGLDRLASEGVRFRNAFITTSLCTPGRSGFLTGQYGHKNGVLYNGQTYPRQNPNWATYLSAAGYTTGYVGKWHHYGDRYRPGFQKTATYWDQGDYFEMPFQTATDSQPIPAPASFTSDWTDDKAGDYALEFINAHAGAAEPWALVVGFKSPHSPFYPPARHENPLYRGQQAVPVPSLDVTRIYWPGSKPNFVNLPYFRTLKGVDDNVARVLARLDELNLDENTVVFFTSDNGFFCQEHDEANDKRSAYEESLRIPLLVRYPAGFATPGTTRDAMAINLDIMPTILDLAGIPVPANVQGRSLAPVLANTQKPADWRKSFFYEYFHNSNKNYPTIFAVRTDTAKMIVYPGVPEWTEVFDLTSDPYEINNLANQPAHASLRTELEAEFNHLLRETELIFDAGTPSLTGSGFTVTYSGGDGPDYQFEWSNDLSIWNPLGTTISMDPRDTNGTATLVDPTNRDDKIFYRARMVIHPEFQDHYLQQNGYLPGELQP